MTHTGIPAGDATVLWTQVAVLLTLAWTLGAAARKLGQPPIVGSLVAGLVAGPSVFGQVWPGGFAWFRPDTSLQGGLLGAIAEFALLILLIALGAETDLMLLRRLGGRAAAVTAGSLALPLAAGGALALWLPVSFMAGRHHRVSFAVLIAAAMTVSSLPVIARIIGEMGMTRRNVGQLSIAAATVNDGVGFVLLALAVALVSGKGAGQLLVTLAGLAGLVVLLFTVGQRIVDRVLRRTRRDGPDVAAGLGVCAVVTFAVAAAAQGLGLDAALGAFLAGIVLGRSRFKTPRVLHTIEWTATAVFAPLYFSTAGLSVDVTKLADGSVAVWSLAIVAVAVTSKFAGVFLGARATRVSSREAVALGVALNGRGALQVILATVGLSAGILSSTAFTVIILLSVVSSVSVPPLLRTTFRHWEGTDDEQRRLAHEAEMSSNVVVRGQRLLLPTRGSVNSVAAARILDLAWPDESEVTMLMVDSDPDARGLDNVRATLASRTVHEEVSDESDTVAAILAEANLGYGAIVVGAADRPTADRPLPEFITRLLNRSPIPLVVVRRGRGPVDGGRPLIRPRRILVPITGNAASRAGQEVAQLISRNTGADLRLLHVVTRPATVKRRDPVAVGRGSAGALVDDARRHAEEKSLNVDVVVRDAAFSGEEIEREATRSEADLVIVGTTVRRVGDQPFLGHTVEHLLEHTTGPTVVVVVLPDAQHAAADEHIDREQG